MIVAPFKGVLALFLGYVVADRALAPLQNITSAARRLSESTLHERIALEGPEDEIKEHGEAGVFEAVLDGRQRHVVSERLLEVVKRQRLGKDAAIPVVRQRHEDDAEVRENGDEEDESEDRGAGQSG